jgi:hypothetical protein
VEGIFLVNEPTSGGGPGALREILTIDRKKEEDIPDG